MVVIALWLALARAEDAVPAEVPPPIEEAKPEIPEIVVHGEALVQQARGRIVRDLMSQGFTDVIDRGRFTIYRHPEPWHGDVLVYDDGWVRMRRQPVRVEGREMPWADKNSPLAWAGCMIYPWLCVRTGGILVGKRKMLSQKERTLAPMQGHVEDYGDRVADLSSDRRAVDLPDALEQLWAEGTALEEGGKRLDTPDQRKQALLDFWESRTDTPWGDQMRAVVETFIRQVVQDSPFAFTPEDIVAFNAQRSSERELDLERPWDQVIADFEGPVPELGEAN